MKRKIRVKQKASSHHPLAGKSILPLGQKTVLIEHPQLDNPEITLGALSSMRGLPEGMKLPNISKGMKEAFADLNAAEMRGAALRLRRYARELTQAGAIADRLQALRIIASN